MLDPNTRDGVVMLSDRTANHVPRSHRAPARSRRCVPERSREVRRPTDRILLVMAEEWILLVGRDIQLGMAAQVLEQGACSRLLRADDEEVEAPDRGLPQLRVFRRHRHTKFMRQYIRPERTAYQSWRPRAFERAYEAAELGACLPDRLDDRAGVSR